MSLPAGLLPVLVRALQPSRVAAAGLGGGVRDALERSAAALGATVVWLDVEPDDGAQAGEETRPTRVSDQALDQKGHQRFTADLSALELPENDDGRDGRSLVCLGPAVRLAACPSGALVVAAENDAVPVRPDGLRVVVPTAPSGDASWLLVWPDDAPRSAIEAALDEVRAASHRETPTEPIDAVTGGLLYALARARSAQRALEVGAGAGAAALWLAAALEQSGGALVTVERDAARVNDARRAFRRAGVAGRTTVLIGDIMRLALQLDGPFDLVVLDAGAEDRIEHLAAVRPHCAPGALIVSRGGGLALAGYTALVRTWPDIAATVTLHAGDGLELSVLEGGG